MAVPAQQRPQPFAALGQRGGGLALQFLQIAGHPAVQRLAHRLRRLRTDAFERLKRPGLRPLPHLAVGQRGQYTGGRTEGAHPVGGREGPLQ